MHHRALFMDQTFIMQGGRGIDLESMPLYSTSVHVNVKLMELLPWNMSAVMSFVLNCTDSWGSDSWRCLPSLIGCVVVSKLRSSVCNSTQLLLPLTKTGNYFPWSYCWSLLTHQPCDVLQISVVSLTGFMGLTYWTFCKAETISHFTFLAGLV